jgi:tetratricopeptide (TPR) repeat protein
LWQVSFTVRSYLESGVIFIFAGYLRTNTMKLLSNTMLLLSCILIFSTTLNAQEVKESAAYQQQQNVYNLAMKYADVSAARNSLFNMIALDPGDASLLDSLAYMYFEYQQFTSCLLVCLDILKVNPDNIPALEMSAVAYDNLGLKDKALTSYESIYLRNNSIFTLYRIAALQLDLSRHTESMTNVNILLEKEETKEAKVPLNTEQGSMQISLEAAVYNLKGLIEADQGNTESARASYQQALSLEPDFTMAKNNLAELDK